MFSGFSYYDVGCCVVSYLAPGSKHKYRGFNPNFEVCVSGPLF